MVRSVNINLEYYLPRIAILHEMLNLQFNEYKISEGSDRKQITEIIKYLCRECIQEFRFIEHFLSDDVFTICGDAKQFIKRMSEFEAQIIEAEKLINEHEELREKLESLPPTDNQLSQQATDLNAQLASATDTIASLQEKLQQSNFDRLESYNFNIAELHRVETALNQYQRENEKLKAKIADLEANEPNQSDTVSKDKLLSNVELNNLKKAVIAENNRQIANILKSMDIRGELSKDDLLQVIRPNMESMAKVLNSENGYKALLVVDSTIKDNHLKSLSFQTGRKTKEQTEKKSIQLIFDREKPPITEN